MAWEKQGGIDIQTEFGDYMYICTVSSSGDIGSAMVATLLSLQRRPRFKTHTWSWNEQIYGTGVRRGPKPRLTLLAKVSSKLLLCLDNAKSLESYVCGIRHVISWWTPRGKYPLTKCRPTHNFGRNAKVECRVWQHGICSPKSRFLRKFYVGRNVVNWHSCQNFHQDII